MKLCAAQLSADIGNIETNVLKHKALIDVAVSCQADVIFFPELSLTGYVPRLAHRLAAEVADVRLVVERKQEALGGAGGQRHQADGGQVDER